MATSVARPARESNLIPAARPAASTATGGAGHRRTRSSNSPEGSPPPFSMLTHGHGVACSCD